jgi:SAM-dependent methyltransferase
MGPVTYDPTIYLGAARHYAVGRPPYSAELVPTLARELGLDGTGGLLDIGCGPGILTIELAPSFAEAVGLDPDADMLDEARRRAEERRVSNVRWVQARAEDIATLAPSLHRPRVVTFGQSFHWTDGEAVAEMVYDLLVPGGAIVLIVHDVEGRPAPPGPDLPAIPHDAVGALLDRYLGDARWSAQAGRRPTMRHEDTLRRTRFGEPRVVYAPGRPDIVRDIDGVVSGYYSMSWATPRLFGDRLHEYDGELRALLREHSPSGRFRDWPGDTGIIIGRKPV